MGVGIIAVAVGIVGGWASVKVFAAICGNFAIEIRRTSREIAWIWVIPAALSMQIVWAKHLAAQPDTLRLVRWIVPISTMALLVMIIRNGGWTGARLVACGVAMNLLVIVTNGGLMPISKGDAAISVPMVGATITEGQPLPGTKDVVLAPTDTRLSFLADHLAVQFPYGPTRVFSPGDIVMLFGLAVWAGFVVRESLLERGKAWLSTPKPIASSSYRATTV